MTFAEILAIYDSPENKYGKIMSTEEYIAKIRELDNK